jgi:plasmid stabilization system protein ParE
MEHGALRHASCRCVCPFLKLNIDDLATAHGQGKKVAAHLGLRYIIIRRKAGGHGHIAVYKLDGNQVNVLHVFHTAQDWQSRLLEEES